MHNIFYFGRKLPENDNFLMSGISTTACLASQLPLLKN